MAPVDDAQDINAVTTAATTRLRIITPTPRFCGKRLPESFERKQPIQFKVVSLVRWMRGVSLPSTPFDHLCIRPHAVGRAGGPCCIAGNQGDHLTHSFERSEESSANDDGVFVAGDPTLSHHFPQCMRITSALAASLPPRGWIMTMIAPAEWRTANS
jgi:hypothetical protein